MAIVYRTAFLEAWIQENLFFPFLSTFFRTLPRDIVDAEKLQIEIKRGSRRVAPVISSVTQRGGRIRKDKYTGKEFTPPVVALSADFAPGDLIEKAFGQNEYQTAATSYATQLMNLILDKVSEIDPQMIRAIEYQIAQILQSGQMKLYDENGKAVYELNFYPKATHFPTVSISWSDEDSTPDVDLENLIDVIESDGETTIENAIFGKTARINYLNNSKVNDKFDLSRMASGTYQPTMRNPGVKFLGNLLVGSTYLDCWQYDGTYIHPDTGVLTKFVADDKVILLPSNVGPNVDLRIAHCRVPIVLPPDLRFSGMVPSYANLGNRAYSLRVWGDDEADALNIEVKDRPLAIPVSIDAFGCLDTEI